MVGTREIRSKIKSIRNTQKITRAMEMVAASRMKKTQIRMLSTRPYVENMKAVISNVVTGSPEYTHEFMKVRTNDLCAYIVVSTDRGLCGGLNVNLFKSILEREYSNNFSDNSKKIFVFAIGKKAVSFFGRFKFAEIVISRISLSNIPVLLDFIGLIREAVSFFLNKSVSKVFLAYNKFLNTMTQRPCIQQLLPVVSINSQKKKRVWDYIYEPSSSEMLDLLFTRYVESLVYQAVIENQACEQAARMVAMKNATENASEVISKFTLIYNKARQSAITQELSEIVAGADAV